MEQEIKVTRNYSFWKHPIKWWKDRKSIAMMDILVNYEWENGMKEEVRKMQHDILLYGSAISKDGKRIDPRKFSPPQPN